MLWIAVHLAQLSLESFAATVDPAWQGRPLALIEAHRITRVDARAAALGIQPGAKRATALALASDLVLGEADAARDASALQAAGHAALAFTPMVCLEAADSTGAPAPVVLLEVQASHSATCCSRCGERCSHWAIAARSPAHPPRSARRCSRAGATISCTALTAPTSPRCAACSTMHRSGCWAQGANIGRPCRAWA